MADIYRLSVSDLQWQQINNLIKEIYLSDVDTLLDNFPSKIQDLMPFSHSMSHSYKRHGNSVAPTGYHSNDLSDAVICDYIDNFENIDYIAWYSDIPISRVYRDTDIIDTYLRNNSDLMKNWLLPNGMCYCLSSTIAYDNVAYGALSFFRSEEEGDFSDLDKMILEILNDHLSIKFHLGNPSVAPKEEDEVKAFVKKHKLSVKEAEIINQIKSGVLREELPDILCISENTLKKHLSNIYGKLHVHSFEQLIQVLIALE